SLLATELGTDLHGLLAEAESIVHGTTVATNALLERKGAKVGLLTTEGHRDIIEMREGLKDDRYNLRMPPPVPLVPRVRRLGVRERMRFDGTVATPLSPRSLEVGITALARAKVEAVAVCYLHSYRNPRHEKLTGRTVARRLPGTYVSLSCEVLPQIKEYERVWTTVVNEYVGPALARYLKNLAARLESHGYRGDVLIIQSHGGVAPVRDATRLAARAVLSGPAGDGKGGTRATVTDANLVLGFLDPANLLGGRIELDTRAARRAVDAIARELGTTSLRAAEGIARVVNINMAEGIKIVSVRRGVDPRRFALVAFGGAAGLHVTEVA